MYQNIALSHLSHLACTDFYMYIKQILSFHHVQKLPFLTFFYIFHHVQKLPFITFYYHTCIYKYKIWLMSFNKVLK